MPVLAPTTFLAQAAQSDGPREWIDNLARTPLSQIVIFVAVLTIVRVLLFPLLTKTPPHKRTGGYAAAKLVNELMDALVYAGVFVFMIIRPFGVQAFLIPSGSMWPTLYVSDFIVANKAIYRYTDPKVNDIVVFTPPKTAVLRPAKELDAQGNVTLNLIKRCVGTPGETVEMRQGILYRNGKPDPTDDRHKHYSNCLNPEIDPCPNFQEKTDAEKEQITKASFKLVNYNGQIIPLNYTEYDANAPSATRGPGELLPPYYVASQFYLTDQSLAKKLEDLPAQPVPPGMYLMMGDNRDNSFDGRAWGLVPREWVIGRAEFIWFPLSRLGRLH